MPSITVMDLYHAYRLYIDEDPTKERELEEPVWNDCDGREIMMWSKRVVKSGFKVKHGDAVHWLGQGYRNEALMFWDAKKDTFVWPHTEIDDYGSVPPNFRVGNEEDEFSPDHWIEDVDHNAYVFVSDTLLAEINKNLNEHVVVLKSISGEISRETHVNIKGTHHKVKVCGEKTAHDVFIFAVEGGIPSLFQYV